MKFFTPELYRRCQSTEDDVVDAASQEWERANEAYERHLAALEPALPPGVRELLALLLHDAKVLSIARQGGRLVMVLHKDIPPHDVVLLDYELAGEPELVPFTDAPGEWSRPTDFQFDELDVTEDEGGRPAYSQAIVFGNGWLLRLLFRDVRVSLAQPVVPVPAVGAVPAHGLMQTA